MWFQILLLIIAMMPYLRYLILANHSFRHYMFTYRLQIITIIAVVWAIYKGLIPIKKYILICIDKIKMYRYNKTKKQMKGMKKMNKQKFLNKEKGITLVALVILL